MIATLLISTYNEGFLIERAFESIQNQQDKLDFEIIIVDDSSTDPTTLKILNTLSKFIKVHYTTKNLGLSVSRNLGFQKASGKFIIPLDGDDYLPENSVQAILSCFSENPKIDFVFGNYLKKDIFLNEESIVDCSEIATDGYLDATKLAKKWILLGTSPCKKSLWEKVGGYDINFSYTLQDVDFWMQSVNLDCIGKHLPEMIYVWERKPTGLNSNFPWSVYDDLKIKNESFYKKFNCTL